MKYKDLIEQLEPFANEDVDIAICGNRVQFWVNHGEFRIAELKELEE